MKKFAPLLILFVLGGIAYIVIRNPPEADRRDAPSGPQMTVDVMTLHKRPYQVKLQSYGTVQPRTQSMLVSQVAGEITSISDSLREGGFFEQGDELLSIDARDYLADVKIAEASLMDAKQALAEQKARSVQALEDWNRLGNKGQAPDLVLRKPQLSAAQSRVISADSALEKSNLELERTRILAPYAGRVMDKMVDQGQVVGRNSQLAEVYAVDFVEIRLPLRNRDLAFIDLPEDYRFERDDKNEGPLVTLYSDLAGRSDWQGRIVRTESAIDDNARQLHVVAQIDNPFGLEARGKTPLKIGQYVTAELMGSEVQDALVIPIRAIYQGTYVYIVIDEILHRRDINIAWQNEDDAIISGGLEEGDALVLTSLGQVTSGVRVSISNHTLSADQTAVLDAEPDTMEGKL
ncbi:MAG: multidrug efflux system membrane fusion protein [Planctomycetota bacterium]|jgi:multidrug efflux system membrane fusion protein